MIADIEAGLVKRVIIKDMSRFGRDYLQVGMYTEIMFPEHDIHFIAVNDGVDSTQGDNEFTPFRNIINEWYAKDTSNKIKAVFKSRMKEGLRCSGAIPYGYKRINGDKQTLVVDEPAAEIVRKVFRLACQGMGVTAIAEQLTEEKVVPFPVSWTVKMKKNRKNAGYLVVSHSGGGMLRQGTRKGIRRTPANRGMRAHWVVKGLDISEDVCHGMCP